MVNDSRALPLDLIVHQGDIAYASTAVSVDGMEAGGTAAASNVGEGGDGEQVRCARHYFAEQTLLHAVPRAACTPLSLERRHAAPAGMGLGPVV